MKVAAIYARVSGDQKTIKNTIASETAALIVFARERGFSVAQDRVIEDDGYRGATLDRPGLERERDFAADGRVEAVLANEPDRLSREYTLSSSHERVRTQRCRDRVRKTELQTAPLRRDLSISLTFLWVLAASPGAGLDSCSHVTRHVYGLYSFGTKHIIPERAFPCKVSACPTTKRPFPTAPAPAILLRRAWREDKRIRKKTIANLSSLPPEIVEGIRRVVKGGIAFEKPDDAISLRRSLAHGHACAVLGTCRQLGLPRILHRVRSRERDLALAAIASRVLEPSSKLATARQLSEATASTSLGALLGLGAVSGNEILGMLDWLLGRQAWIEKSLAGRHLAGGRWCSTTSRPAIWKDAAAPWPPSATIETARRARSRSPSGCCATGRAARCRCSPAIRGIRPRWHRRLRRSGTISASTALPWSVTAAC